MVIFSLILTAKSCLFWHKVLVRTNPDRFTQVIFSLYKKIMTVFCI